MATELGQSENGDLSCRQMASRFNQRRLRYPLGQFAVTGRSPADEQGVGVGVRRLEQCTRTARSATDGG